MAEEIRIGIIGAGTSGTFHARSYQKTPEARVVAVCDIVEERARAHAERFGVPHVYTDYRKMLERDDLDSIDVCLHNRLHMPATVDALESGRHVYCEKPMSWCYRDAKRMLDAAQRVGKMLQVQSGRIFRPGTWCAKRLIDDGHLGHVYAATSTHYRRRGRPYVDNADAMEFTNSETSGTGALGDFGVYNLSRMLHLLGNPEVTSVSGRAVQEIAMYEHRRATAGFDLEEAAFAQVRFANGIVYQIAESWALHSAHPETDEILGSRGGLLLDPLTLRTTLSDMEMDAAVNIGSAIKRWNQCMPDTRGYLDGTLDVHEAQQRHWISALLGRIERIDTAAINLNTVRITEGVYLSSALGREVTRQEIETAEPVSRDPAQYGERES